MIIICEKCGNGFFHEACETQYYINNKRVCKECYDNNLKPTPTKTFKINDLIELRLENGKTNIYVNDKEFEQCKFLMLNLPLNKLDEINQYESIDEVAKKYSKEMEHKSAENFGISPEQEFIAHCSNIQAWYENDYNPDVLHSSMSIPLLKEICPQDFNAFNKLLWYLDNRLTDYGRDIPRALLLLDTYKDIMEVCAPTWKINPTDYNDGFLRLWFINKYLNDFLNIKTTHCYHCDKKIPRHQEIIFELYYGAWSDEPDEVVKVCRDCCDNSDFPYDNDYEYCSNCGRYIDREEMYYCDGYDGSYCEKCLYESFEAHGMDIFEECKIAEGIISHDSLINAGYKLCFESITKDKAREAFDTYNKIRAIVIFEDYRGRSYDIYLKH